MMCNDGLHLFGAGMSQGTNGAIRPISIEHDTGDEDLIVEIIGSFDEIGDVMDGKIHEEEQAEMLKALGF
jgi:hypothetical protein